MHRDVGQWVPVIDGPVRERLQDPHGVLVGYLGDAVLPDGVAGRDLPALPALVSVGKNRVAEVTHEYPMRVLQTLADWAVDHGYPLADISVHRPSLEEIYLRLISEAK